MNRVQVTLCRDYLSVELAENHNEWMSGGTNKRSMPFWGRVQQELICILLHIVVISQQSVRGSAKRVWAGGGEKPFIDNLSSCFFIPLFPNSGITILKFQSRVFIFWTAVHHPMGMCNRIIKSSGYFSSLLNWFLKQMSFCTGHALVILFHKFNNIFWTSQKEIQIVNLFKCATWFGWWVFMTPRLVNRQTANSVVPVYLLSSKMNSATAFRFGGLLLHTVPPPPPQLLTTIRQ